ncbi:cation-transporting P-type ATPase [Mycobacterium tuberculosis]|uniref:cation-transporting P-type ATPase n=1 Tax=Mycobacterium tuberculosis TaxID=1773 RepID=UPI0039F4AC3D
MLLLESDPYHGLSDGEAAQRLERFGPNTLAVVTRASLLARGLFWFPPCSSPARGGCLHGSSTMARACMRRARRR